MNTALKGQPDYVHVRPNSITETNGEVFYKEPIGGAPLGFYDDGQQTFDQSTHDLIRDQIF